MNPVEAARAVVITTDSNYTYIYRKAHFDSALLYILYHSGNNFNKNYDRAKWKKKELEAQQYTLQYILKRSAYKCIPSCLLSYVKRSGNLGVIYVTLSVAII